MVCKDHSISHSLPISLSTRATYPLSLMYPSIHMEPDVRGSLYGNGPNHPPCFVKLVDWWEADRLDVIFKKSRANSGAGSKENPCDAKIGFLPWTLSQLNAFAAEGRLQDPGLKRAKGSLRTFALISEPSKTQNHDTT